MFILEHFVFWIVYYKCFCFFFKKKSKRIIEEKSIIKYSHIYIYIYKQNITSSSFNAKGVLIIVMPFSEIIIEHLIILLNQKV
jgi:hypothetical protein